MFFFQVYYTIHISLLQSETCLLQQLHVLLHVMRLWITRFIIFYFKLKHVNCSSCTVACYAFSVGTTSLWYMYYSLLCDFSMNYALHNVPLQTETYYVQDVHGLMDVMSSVCASCVILYFSLGHTKFKFEGDFLAPAKKGHACHRGN